MEKLARHVPLILVLVVFLPLMGLVWTASNRMKLERQLHCMSCTEFAVLIENDVKANKYEHPWREKDFQCGLERNRELMKLQDLIETYRKEHGHVTFCEPTTCDATPPVFEVQ